MTIAADVLIAVLICLNLALAGVSRLPGAIKLVAIQGLCVGLLPYALHGEHLTIAIVNLLVKGLVLPLMLVYAMKKANTVRELEPLVGFGRSVLLVFAFTLIAFAFTTALPLAAAVALAMIATGLFLIVARRKAITQVLGYLAFENGISAFAAAVAVDHGAVLELGILLDVFALVFILGIAIYEIKCTFSTIDTDRLNKLTDAKYLHVHH